MRTSLQLVVEELYISFKCKKPLKIGNVCTDECCMAKHEAQKLLTLPLEEINLDLIHQYNDNAQATYFDNQEFMYFLPRFFDLISQFQFTSGIDISLSLKNLQYKNNYHYYTNQQKKIIELFCSVFIDHCCENRRKLVSENIFGVITMFNQAQLDIKIVLNQLLKNLENGSIYLVVDLITKIVNERGKLRKHIFADKKLVIMIYNWILFNKPLFKSKIEEIIMTNNYLEEDVNSINDMYDFLDYL